MSKTIIKFGVHNAGQIFFLFSYGALLVSGIVWLRTAPGETAAWLMKLHGGAALLFTLALGSLYEHVRKGFRLKLRLRTGLGLLSAFAIMLTTSWMLYYAGDEQVRHYASLTHWILGLFLPVMILGHSGYLRKLIRRREV